MAFFKQSFENKFRMSIDELCGYPRSSWLSSWLYATIGNSLLWGSLQPVKTPTIHSGRSQCREEKKPVTSTGCECHFECHFSGSITFVIGPAADKSSEKVVWKVLLVKPSANMSASFEKSVD